MLLYGSHHRTGRPDLYNIHLSGGLDLAYRRRGLHSPGGPEDEGRFSWAGSMTVLLLCALPLVHSVWPADCILHSAYTGWRGRPDTDTLAVTASLYFCFLPNAFRMGGLIETALPIVVSCSCSLLLAGIALYQFRREKRGVDSE